MKWAKLQKREASGFRRKLLLWYDTNQRELPWRQDKDPYRVWLSEVMLQQTRVETVIPYYKRFLVSYPDLETLADAPQDDVLKLWEGLGYYSRARNFLQAVQEVRDHYGGRVPDDPDTFAGLRGVGEYTRAAVGSIAFSRPLAVVDGNVKRVFCRLFTIEEEPGKSRIQKEISRLADELLDRERPGDYNQAVMELGALVCIPRSPRCTVCPVSEYCGAFTQGVTDRLPVKSKKKPLPVISLAAVVLEEQGRFLVRQRTEEKLLQGLWEFPNVVNGEETDISKAFAELFHCGIELGEEIMRLSHTFSHLQWDVTVFEGRMKEEIPEYYRGVWAGRVQLQEMAFPVVYHPLLACLNQNIGSECKL
jgi:A/G-specific adenine glycosylase